jgi:hypothetical protein
MFIAQSGSSQINKSRVLAKAQEMAEMMRGCHCSLDIDARAEILKLARALRIVLDKGGITLKEIGFTAAEINAMIVDAPHRIESVTSFGFLQEQMNDEAEDLAEEVEAELVEDGEPGHEEISEVRRKPSVHHTWICGNTRQQHVREDMVSQLMHVRDEQLSGILDVLLPTG